MASRYAPIGEYGVIGDLYTVALVGMDGSIDFLCLPHFDSPSVFAALLDAERGGRFQIAPLLDGAARKQLYLPDTNVLLTRFLDADGVAEVSDFMPVEDAGQAHNLVRRAKTVRGEVRFRMRCEPRFDYARATHTAERRSDTEVLFVGRVRRRRAGAAPARRRSRCVSRTARPSPSSRCGADASAWFVLEVVLAQEPSPSEQPDYESDAFKQTVNFWRRWVARSTYGGRWREMVNRSALTLKLLTSRQHGSIVAAPTFGLPETIGGGRNWDYRYTWIRDSSFTLYGLMRLGYTDEAAAFMRWMMARCARARARRLAPDHVRARRPARAARGDAAPPRGLHGLAPGPHRQRRLRPPAARHLRRADGLGLPVRQVRLAHRVRRLDQRRAADRLGVRQLAPAGRGHLGGARRTAGVPLLAGDVLGGRRPRHPARRRSARSPRRWRAGTRRGTRSTRTSSPASGTRRGARSSSTPAPPRSTPRRC